MKANDVSTQKSPPPGSGTPGQFGLSPVPMRDYFAAKAPIDFDVVCRAWGSDDPNLLEDKTRAAFFAVWALLRYEWADAMLAERAKP